ncbi:hypothetical protein R5R35_009708 [Gryllus longicercus]|uniref:EF-hand domain-containing protein n=1 Tax=Gryllus longicercus TaxID=2509291 RepID=A0AAN9WFW7_9ORTH
MSTEFTHLQKQWIFRFAFLAGLKEVFEVYESQDGKISAKDIGDVLRALEENPTQATIRRFTEQYRPEERVSFDEFLVIYEAVTKNRLTETAEDFIESFRHFDKKGNGNIPHEDLRELLTHHGDKLTRGEVDQLLRREMDDHGNVNIEKFVKKIMANDDEDEGEKSDICTAQGHS